MKTSVRPCAGRWLLVGIGLLGSLTAQAAQEHVGVPMIESVRRLYGLDESAAIDRLAREEEAAAIYRDLEAEPPRGYAGAWFDGVGLRVALAEEADVAHVRALGATPVTAVFSLEELEAARARYLEYARAHLDDRAIQSVHVDVANNRIAVLVTLAALEAARTAVVEAGLDPAAFDIHEGDATIDFSANIRGAVRTRNLTWETDHSTHANICSVGVSVAGGFVTAGHCGENDDQFGSSTGALMGTVTESTYRVDTGSFDGQDSGWVPAAAGWTPVASINGYADGTISVPAKASGLQESPVGSTVCMYGSTSGGPHCGTVTALNVTLGQIAGATAVSNVCSQDGDSGGPFLASASRQVQGTVIGKNANCGGATSTTWFQPVADTLGRFHRTMLTAHGANVATVSNLRCPDMVHSGSGTYSCVIDHYNSQGSTAMEWTRGNGTKSAMSRIWGSCVANQVVTVNLKVTNPYGTYSNSSNFVCPMGPVP